MPRFVLLRHTLPAPSERKDHYDLLLETPAGLLTWQVDQLPSDQKVQTISELPLHRCHYLDYEGPISNNRGNVQRIEGGTFTWLSHQPDAIQVELAGETLRGTLWLTREFDNTHSGELIPSTSWRLSFASASG